MLARNAALLLVLLATAGCVATAGETLRFTPRGDQKLAMREGRPLLGSRLKATQVGIAPLARKPSSKDQTVFLVHVQNTSKAPVEFRIANVTVEQMKDGVVTAALSVKTADELVEDERRRQATISAVAGALGAANVALSSDRGRNRALRENRAAQDDIAAGGTAAVAEVDHWALKDHTIMPGESYQGLMAVRIPAAEDGDRSYRITFPVGGDRHEIDVTQTPSQ